MNDMETNSLKRSTIAPTSADEVKLKSMPPTTDTNGPVKMLVLVNNNPTINPIVHEIIAGMLNPRVPIAA
ncbi:hypothetical protein [Bacillus sp. UNC41MFS5]|uniref:hypothetical protein n=1 Tax=Bacillus sp. UNC41MFS5 TaxID=1449046 RepID=UPI0018CBF40B|nr:hypothetical protein [Bacillus sp. UNC41MFS5]